MVRITFTATDLLDAECCDQQQLQADRDVLSSKLRHAVECVSDMPEDRRKPVIEDYFELYKDEALELGWTQSELRADLQPDPYLVKTLEIRRKLDEYNRNRIGG